MKKTVSFILATLCLGTIVSCEKSKSRLPQTANESSKIQTENFKTISASNSELYKDADFVAMHHNDILLRNISEHMATKYPNLDKGSLMTQIRACASINDMRNVYLSFGIAEGNQIVDLTIQNFGYLQAIAQKFPTLAAMGQADLQNLWYEQWQKVLVLQTIGLTCGQQYAQDMKDCNDAYARAMFWGTAGALAGGALTGGAALAGYGILVAAAILEHSDCLGRAQRDYSNCTK